MKILTLLLLFLVSFSCTQSQNQQVASTDSLPETFRPPDNITIDNDSDHQLTRADVSKGLLLDQYIENNQLIMIWRVPRPCNHDPNHEVLDALFKQTYVMEDKKYLMVNEVRGYVDDRCVEFVYEE
jgi:hypothetical protein